MVFCILTRVDKPADLTAVLSRLGHQQGSSIHLSKDTLQTEGEVDAKLDKKEKEEEKIKKEIPPIVKYIKQQVKYSWCTYKYDFKIKLKINIWMLPRGCEYILDVGFG